MQKLLDFYQDTFHGVFENALLEEFARIGTYLELDEGTVLMRPGGYIRTVPILISGSVKIMRPDEEGREMLLYYLGGLDSCAMSLTCCLQHRTSEILAVVEEKTALITIPVEKVETWICQFSSWKTFVFQTYQKRFEDLLATVDAVAFHKLDERLLALLQKKEHAFKSMVLPVTHEELAAELATSREVISRLLKQLEKLGRVRLSRNKIELMP